MTAADPAVPALSQPTREMLLQVSTATITTQLLARGLRNTFLPGLRASNPGHARMVGEAFTMRCIPSREDIDVLEVFQDYDHPQRKGVESVPPSAVLVIDARGKTRAASLGHILATRLLQRGAAGLVTDGAVRDMAGFEELALPTFTAGAAATTNLAQHHVVDTQVPIGCAEVPVYPGDVIMGDRDGVICIPRHLADEVAQAASEQERVEEFILRRIQDGAPLRGTYPPDQNTLSDYRRSIGA